LSLHDNRLRFGGDQEADANVSLCVPFRRLAGFVEGIGYAANSCFILAILADNEILCLSHGLAFQHSGKGYGDHGERQE
jgi:hypothetical protein